MLDDLVIIETLISSEILFSVFIFIVYKIIIRRVEISDYIVYIKAGIEIAKIAVD